MLVSTVTNLRRSGVVRLIITHAFAEFVHIPRKTSLLFLISGVEVMREAGDTNDPSKELLDTSLKCRPPYNPYKKVDK